jgi:D-alanine-D-alanine ligase
MRAIKKISKGQELTLDYAQFLDENMEPFACQCGASNCRGKISGIPHNTLTRRETNLQMLIQ